MAERLLQLSGHPCNSAPGRIHEILNSMLQATLCEKLLQEEVCSSGGRTARQRALQTLSRVAGQGGRYDAEVCSGYTATKTCMLAFMGRLK